MVWNEHKESQNSISLRIASQYDIPMVCDTLMKGLLNIFSLMFAYHWILITLYCGWSTTIWCTKVIWTRGVSHCGLAITLKGILRQKKNCANSNISPCKNIIFKKSSKRSQNPSRYYNSITNLKFQHKPKYHISKILI
jgi:hypothetical protein